MDVDCETREFWVMKRTFFLYQTSVELSMISQTNCSRQGNYSTQFPVEYIRKVYLLSIRKADDRLSRFFFLIACVKSLKSKYLPQNFLFLCL